MKCTVLIKRWLALKGRTWSPKVHQLVGRWGGMWCEFLGDLPAKAVRPRHLEELQMARSTEGRSGVSLNQERMYFRQFWTWARLHKFAEIDVSIGWRTVEERTEREYVGLTEEQLEALAAAAEKAVSLWFRCYIVIAARTGYRERTMRELKWDCVRWEERCIVTDPWSRKKGQKPHIMPFGEQVRLALGILLELSAGHPNVFPGMPPPNRMFQFMKCAVRAAGAGVPQLTSIHDLRRTFFKRLREQRVPIEDAMILGDIKSKSILLRHYYDGIASPESQKIVRGDV